MRSKYSQFTLDLGIELRQGHFMCHPIAMRFLHQRGFNAVEEVTATQYVEENTSVIPAPHIFDCVSVGNPRCPRSGHIVIQALGRQHPGGGGGKSLAQTLRKTTGSLLKGCEDGSKNYNLCLPHMNGSFGLS